MSKIVNYSNWGWWDRLDGKTLEDDEALVVTWPDGTEEHIQVCVISKTVPIGDHGHEYDGQDVRAYAIVSHHGVRVQVPLVGLKARRV